MRLIASLLLLVGLAPAQSVLTRNADNARSGVYQDKTLTVANVRTRGIDLKTVIPEFGDARGGEALPLFLPGVKLVDGSTRDIQILCSMANVCRGVDAHTGATIWTRDLGQPIQGPGISPTLPYGIDAHQINDKWGVLSTPVAYEGLVYLVAWKSPDGTPLRGVHWIYTLRASTGNIVGNPVSMAGLKTGNQGYSDTMRKQRSSLVLTALPGQHPMVFFAYGTVQETGRAAAGAITAYDTVLKKVTAFLPLSDGRGAGMWMSGGGLAADSKGVLYGQTGNGSFNGVNEWAESILAIVYTPGPTPTLAVKTWFSPYSDAGRVGLDPTKSGQPAPVSAAKLAGVSAPTAEIQAEQPVGGSMSMPTSTHVVISRDAATNSAVPLTYPNNPSDPAWSDEDLGSGGCTLVEQYGKLACAGKDGILFVVNTANMGNTQPADFANAKANCAKLASPPVWFASSAGGADPCPQDPRQLNFKPYGKTRHLHMTPVQYMSPSRGLTLFGGGENSAIHAWEMAPSGAMMYLAESRETASPGSVRPPGGMPGSFLALSTDQFKLGTSILWASIPYGDANQEITQGHLVAYDAENYARDTDGWHLVKLWDSADWGITWDFNKFAPPVIWGGQIYLLNYNGGEQVFGLTAQP